MFKYLTYKLNSKKPLGVKIDEDHPITKIQKDITNPNQFYLLAGRKLVSIQIDVNGKSQKLWEKTFDEIPSNVQDIKTDHFYVQDNYLIISTLDGLVSYKINPVENKINLINDYRKFPPIKFHQFFRQFKKANSPHVNESILFGQIINAPGMIGFVTLTTKRSGALEEFNGIRLWLIDESEMEKGGNEVPVYDIRDGDYDEMARIQHADISIQKVNLDDQLPQVVVRHAQGVKTYIIENEEVRRKHDFTGIMGPLAGNEAGHNEITLFGTIFKKGQNIRDLDCVVRNADGLYLYEAVGDNRYVLRPSRTTPMFSDEKGWNNIEWLKTFKLYDATGDGIDELVFTGPDGIQILSYDYYEDAWYNLLDSRKIKPSDRHVQVLVALNQEKKVNLLVENSNGAIEAWNLDGVELKKKDVPKIEAIKDDVVQKPNFPIPSGHVDIPNAKMLPLKDILNYDSFMKNTVEPMSGKPKFRIALMDMISRHLNFFSLNYDGGSDTEGVLGLGWSVPQYGQIVVVDQGCLFPETHRYFLIHLENTMEIFLVESISQNPPVIESDKEQKKREEEEKKKNQKEGEEEEEEDDDVEPVEEEHFFNYYSLVRGDKTNANIMYDTKKQIWTVKTDGQILIYGSETATGYDMVWAYWRGRGNSYDNRVQIPVYWNLAEIRNTQNEIVTKLKYVTDEKYVDEDDAEEEAEGTTYTAGIYLTYVEAATENGKVQLEINYEEKTEDEIKKQQHFIGDGNYEKQTTITKYMTGYKVQTPEFVQQIEFEYNVDNNVRKLMKINQKMPDTHAECVLEFNYDPDGFLKQIVSPENLKTELATRDYEDDSHNYFPPPPIRSEAIELDSNVFHGNDYIFLTYLTKDERRVTGKLFSSDLQERMIYDGTNGLTEIIEYNVFASDNMITICSTSRKNKKKEVIIFTRRHFDDETKIERPLQDVWNMTPKTYHLSERGICSGGRDFVVLADVQLKEGDECYDRVDPRIPKEQLVRRHTLRRLEYKKGELEDKILVDSENLEMDPKFEHPLHNNTVTHEIITNCESSRCLFFVPPVLSQMWKNETDDWNYRRVVLLRNHHNKVVEMFDKFDIECERKKFMIHTLKRTSIQQKCNVVFTYRLSITEDVLFAHTKLIMMGPYHNYARIYEKNQPKDHLIAKEFGIPRGSLIYRYEWRDDSKQYKVFATIADKEDDAELNEGESAAVSEQTAEMQKQQAFLLNIREYVGRLTDRGELIQNDTTLVYDGSSWAQKPAPKELNENEPIEQRFSDKYNLTQASAGQEVYLKHNVNGQMIRLAGCTDMSMIISGPQSFLLYKNKKNDLKMLRMDTNGEIVGKEYTLSLEQVSPDTNSQWLITYGNYTREQPTINFRRIDPKMRTKIVEKHELHSLKDGTTRVTGFMHERPRLFGTNVLFEQVTLKPNYDVRQFGSIVFKNNFKDPKKSYTITYNGDGQPIKQDNPEAQQISDEEKEWQKKAKEMTILDKERQVHIFAHAPFKVSSGEVYANGFEKYEYTNEQIESYNSKSIETMAAPCGKQVLRLKSGNKYTFKITPEAQYSEYKFTVLAQVSPPGDLPIGSLFPSIKANIYEDSNYRFTTVSMVKIERDGWHVFEIDINLPFLKELNEKHSSKPKDQAALKIKVSIVPQPNQNILIDQIFFAPKDLRSTINVYDYSLWKVTCELSTSGLFIQRIYDKNNNEIAICDEYNQVQQFHAYSKLSTQQLKGDKFKTEISVAGATGHSFNDNSFANHWKIDNLNAWALQDSKLFHINSGPSTIKLHIKFDINSICLRFDYILYKDESNLQINNNILLQGCDLRLIYNGQPQPYKIPYKGEIIFIIRNDRLWLLIDGIPYLDNQEAGLDGLQNIELTPTEFVSIERMIVLSDPQISMTYLNSIGEEQQKVHLINHNQVIVRAWTNDLIGRKVTETFPIVREKQLGERLLGFHDDVIPGPNFKHKIISYFKDPLSNIEYIDMPNTEFTASNGTIRRFVMNPMEGQLKIITRMYPIMRGYTYQTEMKSGAVRELCVYNSERQRALTYVYVPNVLGILSTYKHNERNKLIKTLTPNFHEENETLRKEGQENPDLEQYYAYTFEYDKYDNPIVTTGPDSGKRVNIYNGQNLLKFMITYCYEPSNRSQACSVIFMNYDSVGRLISSGYLNEPRALNPTILNTITEKEISEETEELRNSQPKIYQKLQYNDGDNDPYREGNVKRVMTYYPHKYMEEYVTNIYKKLVTKRLYLPPKDNKIRVVEINEEHDNGKVKKAVQYPFEFNGSPLKVQFKYNTLNQIIAVEITNINNLVIAAYKYNPEGYVKTETLYPNNNKIKNVREFKINEIGSYSEIVDKYLHETIEYTTPGYGNYGFGDGSITMTKFNAKWHKNAHDGSLQLNKASFASVMDVNTAEQCYDDLKRAGYIDQTGHQTKIFYNEYDENISPKCYEHRQKIAQIMGTRGFPATYGHLYDYGNSKQLTKAKYFVESHDNVKPLQPDTFQNSGCDPNELWKSITTGKTKFITVDHPNPNIPDSAQGKRYKSLVNQTLLDQIKNDISDLSHYSQILEPLLLQLYCNRKFTFKHLEKYFTLKTVNELERKIGKIDNIIDPTLRAIPSLSNENTRQHVVCKLKEHFAKQIGEAEFDVESYEMDANGNHKKYRTGFDFTEIEYEKPRPNLKTNIDRIKQIRKNYVDTYQIKHDSLGNVIEAQHKNIAYMKYDPVINKVAEVGMANGKVIKYGYDVKGDRIFKKIYANSRLAKEVFYIRDGDGKCLVQRDVKYIANSKTLVTLTAYLYGPKGIIGFIRNGNIYTVFTDHEGSIRLVEKNGEVVAAYDYYPYGCLMRSYGKDPDAHISYRYAGHEWDEETGLYYMIARYYDCELGRFYQMDPMAQYFSPYLYAGNSPVAMVDPDGEFAFLLIILICAVVGAYLGGAAANGSWNPVEWDWTSADTWLGMVGGAVAGALLPFGAVQSVGALVAIGAPAWAAWATVTAVGIGFALFEGAKVQGTWNVFEWDFSDPKLINAIFTGFSSGVGIIGDISSFRQAVTFFKGLSAFKKCLFVGAAITTGAMHIYIEGASREWNVKDPDFWKSMIIVGFSAPQGGMAFVKGWDKAAKRFTSFKTLIKEARSGARTFRDIMTMDTAKKVIKYSVEVLALTEATASMGLDLTLAIMSDQVLWNAIGSKAYSVRIREMLDDQNAKDRRWQAAMTYVPTKFIQLITGFRTLESKIDKNDVNTLYDIKRGGGSISSHLKALEAGDKKHLAYSIATKQITTIDDLKDAELCIIHNHEAHIHVVTIVSPNNKKITKIDDSKLNQEIQQAIQSKKNEILQECNRKFNNIKNSLRENIIRAATYPGCDQNQIQTNVDTLMANAALSIQKAKPFKNALNNNIRLLLRMSRINLNNQIVQIVNAKKDYQALMQLLAYKIEIGPSSEVQLTKILEQFEQVLLEIEDTLYNWVQNIDEKNLIIVNRDTILPLQYEDSDLIYTEGKESIYSKVIEECESCPDTIANHMHQSEKDLAWLAELDSINTDDGLLLEPVPLQEPRHLQKRDLYPSTNVTITEEQQQKTKKRSWLMSKWSSCLKYLNIDSSSDDKLNEPNILRAADQQNHQQLFNNRPQIEQELPQTKLEFTPDYSIADVNSTLFLIDMCVRKITGERFVGRDGQISVINAQLITMNIIDDVENMLNHILIDTQSIDSINFPELQCKIFQAIFSGTRSKIPDIIVDYLNDVLDNITAEEKNNIQMYFERKCQ